MDEAARILHKHWRMDGPLRREASGGSRPTWQTASGDWLSRCARSRIPAFQNETSLLAFVHQRLVATGAVWTVPEIMPTAQGDMLALEADSAWRLTRGMAGTKFGATDLRTYPALIEALDRLHAVLRETPQAWVPVRDGVATALARRPKPTAPDPLVAEVWAWLQPRLQELQQLPTQVTHGDFNPTNVLYREQDGKLAVYGVLDFELSRPDPTIMDFSQLLTMMLCHSGPNDLPRRIEWLLALLQPRFTREDLRLAALAYWLELYLQWQEDAATEAKLRLRLRQVWQFA